MNEKAAKPTGRLTIFKYPYLIFGNPKIELFLADKPTQCRVHIDCFGNVLYS